MSVELAQEHLAWNLEAVERCAVLSTQGSCPAHVRQLFQGSGPQQATNSCLLEQISRLIMAGLASSADACVKASEAPYGVCSAGSAVRSAITKAASTVRPYAAEQCFNHLVGKLVLSWHPCLARGSAQRTCTTLWLQHAARLARQDAVLLMLDSVVRNGVTCGGLYRRPAVMVWEEGLMPWQLQQSSLSCYSSTMSRSFIPMWKHQRLSQMLAAPAWPH